MTLCVDVRLAPMLKPLSWYHSAIRRLALIGALSTQHTTVYTAAAASAAPSRHCTLQDEELSMHTHGKDTWRRTSWRMRKVNVMFCVKKVNHKGTLLLPSLWCVMPTSVCESKITVV